MSELNLPLPALTQVQADYLKQATDLWNQSLQQLQSPPAANDAKASAPAIGDRRFAGQEWIENPAAAYVAQMYLLNARTLLQLAEQVRGDEKTRARIRFAVGEGHRLFVVSWRNADDSMAHLTWDDYIEEGAIRAMRVVQEVTGSPVMNTLGFCIGGTILATALAVLAARGERPASSMKPLTTFLDLNHTRGLEPLNHRGRLASRGAHDR